MRELELDAGAINQNTFTSTTWTWHDNNGNKLYEAGEVNLDRNGSDFRSSSGSALGVVNPNEKQPKTHEFSGTFERELLANTAVRVTGVYTRNVDTFAKSDISRQGQYTIPITNPDPGPDGRLGTADDTGRSITYYEYPTSIGGAAFARTMQINRTDADAKFKTFEVAVTKRSSRGWQAGVSYSTTWMNVPVTCGGTSPPVGGGASGSGIGVVIGRCVTNPNQAFNTANNTREQGAKLSGAYNLPFGIQAAANYDFRSGAPQARQVLFTGGQTIRSILLNVEPFGSIALPNSHNLDVRAAKRVNLGGTRSVELRFDIYNALNTNTVLVRNLQSGPNYLRPSRILPSRILQIGTTFIF
jgi:hypothetical protein